MRVLVTGAAGFIGRALVERLTARPEVGEVIALDLAEISLADPAVRTLRGDLAEIGRLLPARAPPDIVFHVAGITTQACEADPDLAFRVNVEGTRHLLAWCRALARPPRFVFTSSVAVFGAGEVVVDEASRVGPASTYGTTKVMAEALVADATRRRDVDGATLRLPVTMVRPGRTGRAGAGYMSDLIRSVVAGRPFVAPLAADRIVPVASVQAAVSLLERLGFSPAPPPLAHVPALAASGEAMLAALRACGFTLAPGQIAFAPDAEVERLVAGWPSDFGSRFGGPPETLADILASA